MNTHALGLTMPPAVTAADIAAARQVLAQVLRCNPDLPRPIVTEAGTAMVLLNELAPPLPIAIRQGDAANPIEAAIEDAARLVGDTQALRLLATELVARLLAKPEALSAIGGELSDLDDVRNGTGIGQQ